MSAESVIFKPFKAGCVLVDFPWGYTNFKGAENGSAMASMKVQPLDYGKAIKPLIDVYVGEDSLMIFWATWPKLEEAFDLLRFWDVEVVTGFPWIKTTKNDDVYTGIGHWCQSTSEIVLICRRPKSKFKRARKPSPPF